MPEFFWRFGRLIADAWYMVTGCRINDFEGYMIVVSTILMIISLVGWIIIDLGNEKDRLEAEESNRDNVPPVPRPAAAQARESVRKQDSSIDITARKPAAGSEERKRDSEQEER